MSMFISATWKQSGHIACILTRRKHGRSLVSLQNQACLKFYAFVKFSYAYACFFLCFAIILLLYRIIIQLCRFEHEHYLRRAHVWLRALPTSRIRTKKYTTFST